MTAGTHARRPSDGRAGLGALVLGALGVVFGDIGTSPLYTVEAIFAGGRVPPTADNVRGIFSLVIWALTLVVSVKYVAFVMRADNDGEGGIMALIARVRELPFISRRARAALVLVGLAGVALFVGDGMITPAISVLAAVEGLELAAPQVKAVVLPLALGILIALFAVQRLGTAAVSHLFGPIMAAWFAVLALTGLAQLTLQPAILASLSPTYALAFGAAHPGIAFVALGAVVLAVTGAEALYANMGHFGRPVGSHGDGRARHGRHRDRVAGGDLGHVLARPAGGPARLPPTAADRPHIGARDRPGLRAGGQRASHRRRPGNRRRLRILGAPGSRLRPRGHRHIRDHQHLFVAIARRAWRWSLPMAAAVGGVLLLVDVTFFAANLNKVPAGGWLPLLIAAVAFVVLTTWHHGRDIVIRNRSQDLGPLEDYIERLHGLQPPLQRLPGTAVFLDADPTSTPLALRAQVEHGHSLHRAVILLVVATEARAHVDISRRIDICDLGDPDDGIVQVTARFGFKDHPDVPASLRLAAARGLTLDVTNPSYYVSRTSVALTDARGMRRWRKRLYLALTKIAADPVAYFSLPDDRVVITGSRVRL